VRKGIALAAFLFAALTYASVSTAEVLINEPLSRACLGHSIDVGVWWKQTTDERSYRVQLFDPSGRVVLSHAGEAPLSWLIWHYVPRRTGVYRAVYDSGGQSSTYDTNVRASGCFTGNVAGAGSGPGHRFVVGDGLYLNFRDSVAYGTPYRVCWQRTDGAGLRCWSRRSSITSHLGRIFTPAPERVGKYVARWYVHGRLVATWRFYNGLGD
jgi:hypothetical protein